MITRAVLTFHGVDDRAGALSYPPADFEALLATLAAASVPIVSLDALLATDTTSGVSLTFDDGMRSVFDVALPILRRHGAPAHLFLRTGAVGGATAEASACPTLDWDQINLLAEGGVAIESHTHSHQDLRVLSDAEIDAECAMADTLIERHVGQRPRYFASIRLLQPPRGGARRNKVCGRIHGAPRFPVDTRQAVPVAADRRALLTRDVRAAAAGHAARTRVFDGPQSASQDPGHRIIAQISVRPHRMRTL